MSNQELLLMLLLRLVVFQFATLNDWSFALVKYKYDIEFGECIHEFKDAQLLPLAGNGYVIHFTIHCGLVGQWAHQINDLITRYFA
jgi:hypothetical protein